MHEVKLDKPTHITKSLMLSFHSAIINEDELLKDEEVTASCGDGNINLVSAGVSKMQVDEGN